MKRWTVLIYGVGSYLLFLGVFLYLLGFVGNLWVPVTMDGPANANIPLGWALAVDFLLVVLFGVQHSIMARASFKRWLLQFVPEPVERCTYVLSTNLMLILLFWQWQPLGIQVWEIQEPALRILLYSLFALGWLTVLATTFMINHFDLFGLRQTWLYFRGVPYSPLPFRIPAAYQIVRHPLYVGWIIAFWATPSMSLTHLLFAVSMTVYILIAIVYEERDLVQRFGKRYQSYQQSVPMLVPGLKLSVKPSGSPTGLPPTPEPESCSSPVGG